MPLIVAMATVAIPTKEIFLRYPTQSQLVYRLGMLQRLHRFLCNDKINRIGILQSHITFIANLLNTDQPVSQEELANRLAIDKGTTARALEQLEAKGLVRRETNAQNRRQKLVSATDHAHTIANDLFAALNGASEVLLEGFSPNERQMLLSFLDRMIQNGMREKY